MRLGWVSTNSVISDERKLSFFGWSARMGLSCQDEWAREVVRFSREVEKQLPKISN